MRDICCTHAAQAGPGKSTTPWTMSPQALLLVLLLVGLPWACFSPPTNGQRVTITQYCSYAGQSARAQAETLVFPPDKEAQSMVGKVLQYTGLKPNFVLFVEPGSKNAAATIGQQQRLILYDPVFLRNLVYETKTDWAQISVLAHELGHHLLGHTLSPTGSRPAEELDADEYSGFILQKMGATLEQATAAIKQIASDQASQTHPAKKDRIQAISTGWQRAHEFAQKPVYTAKCILYGHPTPYYVAANNVIVGVNAFGQPVLVGKKIPPLAPQFAWMFQVATGAYGVDANGVIWGLQPTGGFAQAGHVTTP